MAFIGQADAAMTHPPARLRARQGGRRARRLLAAGLLCLGTQAAVARTIYVTPSGSGPG